MDELRQLREENKQLKQENKELRQRLVATETKIKQLVELLGQNSRNSNWRPAVIKVARSPNLKACAGKRGAKQGDKKGTKDKPSNSIQSQM